MNKRRYFIGCFNKSVILTYIGVLLSFLGMQISLNANVDNRYAALNRVMIILILVGLCDTFDGVIARRCKRNDIQKQFGVQIDSLCDVISFGIFPVIILYSFKTDIISNIIITAISILYIITIVTRLAWFNINHNEKTFIGVPVTYIALVMPFIQLITCNVNYNIRTLSIPITMLIMSIAYILNIKIPKLNKKAYIAIGVLAIIFITLFIVLGV